MSGGRFARCPACGRLCIYGQTCICGQRTDMPVEEERPDGTPPAAYRVTTLLHRRPELRPIARLAAVLDEQVRWSA